MSLRRSARLSITPSQNNSPAPQEKVTAKPLKKTAKAKADAPKSTARKRKEPGAATASPSDAKTTNASEPSFPVPVTPNSKRPRTSTNLKPPPVTPTPSAVALIAEPQPASQPESQSQLDSQSQSQPISTPNTASKKRKPARPADPHATNAVLATPGGSKVAAYSDTSPVKWSSDVPLPSTTTDNLLDEACKHLISVDPKLKSVIEKHHCKIFSPEGLAEKVDPFKSLSTGIMGQQVSGAAASSIKKKFIALFPESPSGFPSPAEVAATPIETLRTAGLSQRKAEYIQGLAEKFVSGELSTRMLIEASDQEVLEKLTAVRGLGRWSVEMFACFALKRLDVFSTGDLGVQRGMAVWLGKDVSKLKNKGGKWKYMTEKEMLDHSAKFAPYRSLFMWYLWRIEDVDVSVMQG